MHAGRPSPAWVRVRVSRLLGSVVGCVGESAPACANCMWVNDSVCADVLWDGSVGLYDVGGGCSKRKIGVAGNPAAFYQSSVVVNSKWIVRCGHIFVEPPGNEPVVPVMLTMPLNVQFDERGTWRWEFSESDVKTASLAAFVQSSYSMSDTRFLQSRPNDLLMVVLRRGELNPMFLVVDIKETHASGSLEVLSITHAQISITPQHQYLDVLPLQRNDGTLSFITQTGCIEKTCNEVDEITGVARELHTPSCSYWPISDCEYFDGRVREDGKVPIWNCNHGNSPNPAKLIQMPKKTLESWEVAIKGASGFLIHVDTAACRVTVIDVTATPPFTVLVLLFPLWVPAYTIVHFAS